MNSYGKLVWGFLAKSGEGHSPSHLLRPTSKTRKNTHIYAQLVREIHNFKWISGGSLRSSCWANGVGGMEHFGRCRRNLRCFHCSIPTWVKVGSLAGRILDWRQSRWGGGAAGCSTFFWSARRPALSMRTGQESLTLSRLGQGFHQALRWRCNYKK